MVPKYTIDHTALFKRRAQPSHHSNDNPVACEEFVEQLSARGFDIRAIKRGGLEQPKHEFDHYVKMAAEILASKRICASLDIKPKKEKHRFGFRA